MSKYYRNKVSGYVFQKYEQEKLLIILISTIRNPTQNEILNNENYRTYIELETIECTIEVQI